MVYNKMLLEVGLYFYLKRKIQGMQK